MSSWLDFQGQVGKDRWRAWYSDVAWIFWKTGDLQVIGMSLTNDTDFQIIASYNFHLASLIWLQHLNVKFRFPFIFECNLINSRRFLFHFVISSHQHQPFERMRTITKHFFNFSLFLSPHSPLIVRIKKGQNDVSTYCFLLSENSGNLIETKVWFRPGLFRTLMNAFLFQEMIALIFHESFKQI